jgi:uncharacterized protein YegP (UPF0339 family)
MKTKIKSIKKIDPETRYDIEVADNHNFFANNILVHNCRAIIRLEKGEIVARTRNGKIIEAIPHITNSLKSFFQANENTILDGELYNHELKDNFNKITSLVRKQKPTKKKSDT